jgi:hypothetical protein
MNYQLRRRVFRAAPLLILVCFFSPATLSAHHLNLPLKCAMPQSQPDAAFYNPVPADVAAQVPNAQAGQSPASPGKRKFFKDLLDEQKAIWTSPLRIKKSDAKWLVPFAALTALAISTDRQTSAEVSESKDKIEDSRDVSGLGSGYATFGAAGSLYLIGRLTHNERLKETGVLGVEALFHSSIVVTGLKLITGRERPESGQGQGHFFNGGKSFPSGHAITAWALAAVIGQEYHDQPVIRFGAYAVASLVALSRFTGRNHFPSDVLVGSTLGYLIGSYTVNHHGTTRNGHPLPTIQPYFSRAAHVYGVVASLSF